MTQKATLVHFDLFFSSRFNVEYVDKQSRKNGKATYSSTNIVRITSITSSIIDLGRYERVDGIKYERYTQTHRQHQLKILFLAVVGDDHTLNCENTLSCNSEERPHYVHHYQETWYSKLHHQSTYQLSYCTEQQQAKQTFGDLTPINNDSNGYVEQKYWHESEHIHKVKLQSSKIIRLLPKRHLKSLSHIKSIGVSKDNSAGQDHQQQRWPSYHYCWYYYRLTYHHSTSFTTWAIITAVSSSLPCLG